MDDERRKRIQDALNKFASKDLKEIDKLQGTNRPKKNKSPEKEVQNECLAWMRARQWAVAIYESKATYDPRRGRYISQSMKAGNADCQGTMPGGISVIVEFKAPGKLQAFCQEKNQRQIDYIMSRIKVGAFACVTDSANRLEKIFIEWERQRTVSFEAAQAFLLSVLPTRK